MDTKDAQRVDNEKRLAQLRPVLEQTFAQVDDIADPYDKGAYAEYDPNDLRLLREARDRLAYAVTTQDADVVEAELDRMMEDMQVWFDTGTWPKRAIVIKPSGPPREDGEDPEQDAEVILFGQDKSPASPSIFSTTAGKIGLALGGWLLWKVVRK